MNYAANNLRQQEQELLLEYSWSQLRREIGRYPRGSKTSFPIVWVRDITACGKDPALKASS